MHNVESKPIYHFVPVPVKAQDFPAILLPPSAFPISNLKGLCSLEKKDLLETKHYLTSLVLWQQGKNFFEVKHLKLCVSKSLFYSCLLGHI